MSQRVGRYSRDTTNSLNFSRLDKVQCLDLFNNRADKLYFTTSKWWAASFLDLSVMSDNNPFGEVVAYPKFQSF